MCTASGTIGLPRNLKLAVLSCRYVVPRAVQGIICKPAASARFDSVLASFNEFRGRKAATSTRVGLRDVIGCGGATPFARLLLKVDHSLPTFVPTFSSLCFSSQRTFHRARGRLLEESSAIVIAPIPVSNLQDFICTVHTVPIIQGSGNGSGH